MTACGSESPTCTMSRFLNSLADKAQSAINASPLAGHLPAGVTNALNAQTTGAQAGTPTPSVQTGGVPTGSPAGGSGRHYAIENLQHSLRALQVQYSCVIAVYRPSRLGCELIRLQPRGHRRGQATPDDRHCAEGRRARLPGRRARHQEPQQGTLQLGPEGEG